MMTPMHTDLAKHLPATHAAPTDHERDALRALRTERRQILRRLAAALAAALPRRAPALGRPAIGPAR